MDTLKPKIENKKDEHKSQQFYTFLRSPDFYAVVQYIQLQRSSFGTAVLAVLIFATSPCNCLHYSNSHKLLIQFCGNPEIKLIGGGGGGSGDLRDGES